MLALVYLLAGAALCVVSVGALAGGWWGALAGGAVLVTLGVLEARGDKPEPATKGGKS